MRIKTKWANKEREISVEETASALAFNGWRIAMRTMLNLENEGFEPETNMQRIEVMEELLALIVHVTDRLMHEVMSDEDRARLITAFALKLADHVQDNTRDFAGPGDYRKPFIDRLNQRMDDLAELSFGQRTPGFSMRRYVGERVTGVMTGIVDAQDAKWISDQVMDVEIPQIMSNLLRVIRGLALLGEQESNKKAG